MHTKKISFALVVSMLLPSLAIAADPVQAPFEKDFILTAYYSPVANQCCYVKGSEEADKVLNGGGTRGADGAQVYPGMVAAPASYAFGTRISLPGLGVMAVHDRGGAIQSLDHGDRLDVWVGYGEEGLARALAFGVRHIHGTVYPVGNKAPAESFDLTDLTSPPDRLKPYLVADMGLLDMHPKSGQTGLSVEVLQQALQKVGYFKGTATGTFGDGTVSALASFNKDYALPGNGKELTVQSAAYLTSAIGELHAASPVHFIDASSPKSDIQEAQRLLRWLGTYKGRTDGVYSDTFVKAIVAYQQGKKLVADATSPGAGRIGPVTRNALIGDWKQRVVGQHASTLLSMKRVGDMLDTKGALISTYLSPGQNGAVVRAVQEFLVQNGLFPADKVNGNYGDLTKQSVLKYQLSRGIILSAKDKGAGSIGPSTLHALRSEQIQSMFALVRAKGWGVL
jgi:peptidoglycan hydrolase-like protein with peptidoglycan-binding domain/3D (Asp-Asp-Asp) domain-containing protein